EDTTQSTNGTVRISNTRDAKKNIRRRGEDIRKGAVVLTASTALGPAQLGVLASIAHDRPLVHRVPQVAFMGSGDEIVDLDRRDEILAGKKIATSNFYTLYALFCRFSAVPVNLGVACCSWANLLEDLRCRANRHFVVTLSCA